MMTYVSWKLWLRAIQRSAGPFDLSKHKKVHFDFQYSDCTLNIYLDSLMIYRAEE